MKKRALLLVLLLSLSILPGCRSGTCISLCIYTGVVTVRYPNGDTARYTANSQGCVYLDSRGHPCHLITVTGRVRSAFFGLFTLSPNSINIQAPPSVATVYGYNISAAYGMPKVEYNDQYGRTVASATATAVAPDGSWAQIPIPDLSNCYTGQFNVLVVNKTWDGGEEEVGYGVVDMWGRDRPDADGDGWFADQECDDTDPFVHPGALADCSGWYFDRNCNGLYDANEYECNPNSCSGNYLNRPIEPLEPCYIY